MDVRLPDGTVISNVPDGITKADLTARLSRNGYDVSKLGGPAPAAPAGPADDVGMGQAALIAAGRGVDKTLKGVEQAYRYATGDQPGLDAMAATEQDNDRVYRPLQDKFPKTTALAENAQMLAIPMGGAAGMIAKSALAGAVPGALGYGTLGERAGRAAVGAAGGAAGGVVGNLVGRVLKPAGAGFNANPAAMDAASRIGFKPTAAQATQSPALGNLENYFSKNPGSAGVMSRIAGDQQTALNSTAAKAMGETATDLGEGTFAAAQSRIGGEFSRLQDVTQPKLGDDFFNAVARIDSANTARGPFANPSVSRLVDKGLDLAAANNLSGKAYKEIRTELSSAAQTAFKTGDATAGQAYKTLREALDDAAKSGLSEADQKAWDVARQQWGAFKTLSKSNVAEAGNVSAPRVAAEVRRAGPGLRTGAAQGPLADIARVGEQFKGVSNPNSGNLVNQLAYQNMLGPAMMLGNRVGAEVYNNPLVQRYARGGLIDVGKQGNALLGRAGALVGVPSAQGLLGVE